MKGSSNSEAIGQIRRPHIRYTQGELEWIKSRREMPRRELHKEFCKKFGRADVALDNFKALCKRKGWLTGRTGHYGKGATPANKGRKQPYHPNTARTQFKPGSRPQNTKWAGHQRVNTLGYVEISVEETNPHTGFERRYVHKHRHLWEQAHGPVPDAMVLKCLDGNKTNTDPSNWELIPRAMLPRLNGRFGRGFDTAPAELKPAIMATAKLEHRARTAKKGKPGEAAK